MRIEEDGSLNIPREEVELLISYVRKALLIPSKNTVEEEETFDKFIVTLKTISGDFHDDTVTY
jgi:hypothetical protein